MSKYIRVNGILYTAIDAADPKMLKILMSKVNSILKPLESKGFRFKEVSKVNGIDVYATSKQKSLDDLNRGIYDLWDSLKDVKSKIEAIQELPYFYRRWALHVDYPTISSGSKQPWLVARIVAKELNSGKDLLAKSSMTREAYMKSSEMKVNSIRALGYLKKELSKESPNFGDVLKLAGRIGKLDPKSASEISIWVKRVSSEKKKFLSMLDSIQ